MGVAEKRMPNVYIIGGPNGAGKTTIALKLFPEILASREFVNADLIAKGLSAFDMESVAMQAGRFMLERIHELRLRNKDFAFESTLASRFLAPFLRECKRAGYGITLIYVWIENAQLARERIRKRVREGGHSIPDEIVTRRYARSVANFRALYMPLADELRIYDNTHQEPRIIAHKEPGRGIVVELSERMERIMKTEVREPQAEYRANRIDLAVKAAIAEELDRKRKLGLPIVVGGGDRVLIMIGDTVVEEIPYGERKSESKAVEK